MDRLQRQNWVRCKRKRTYRNPDHADEAAQRASIRAGKLIISYQCYDCLKWHIGQADTSQILARAPQYRHFCEVCGNLVPPARIDKTRSKGMTVNTCSKKCWQELKSRTARPPQPAASPTVPKGVEKPNL